MLDFKFDWCSEMETGHPLIDTQHKELFRIGREIEQLVMCHCIGVTNKQLLTIVLELRDYVAYHFYHEENIMKEVNYPNFMTHKEKHNDVIQFILTIDLKELSKEPYKVLSKIKAYLQDWIFSHILIEDVALGKYINAHSKDQSAQ